MYNQHILSNTNVCFQLFSSFFLLLNIYFDAACVYITSSIATNLLTGTDRANGHRTACLHIDCSRSLYFYHQFPRILWSYQRIPCSINCLRLVHHHHHPSPSCPDRCCSYLQSRGRKPFEKVLATHH